MVKRLIFLTTLLLMLSTSSYAISLGISPGRAVFQDMLREGYAERTVRLSSNSDEVITGHFTAKGDLAQWLSFEPNTTNFNVSSGSPFVLKLKVNVPVDARNDDYSGKIEFVTDIIGSTGGRAGSFIKAGVTLNLYGTVVDQEIRNCVAGGFSIGNMEVGERGSEFSYQVVNRGNVRISPVVEVDIWDRFQENILLSRTISGQEVLPTAEENIRSTLSLQSLEVGQYWATVTLSECGADDLIGFSVVEKGTIADEGALTRLYSKPWVYSREPVEVVAEFTNNGPRTVSAVFKGTVKQGDEVVQVIESDEVDVPSNGNIEIKTFFEPTRPGRYVVSGRVYFNKKLSFERGTVVNVTERPDEEPMVRLWMLFAYVAIIITIIYLIRKIIKSKKRRPF